MLSSVFLWSDLWKCALYKDNQRRPSSAAARNDVRRLTRAYDIYRSLEFTENIFVALLQY